MRSKSDALLVSLKPRFAEMLLDGCKSVELRRVRPAVAAGALVLLYASSPRRELVGTGRVGTVEVGSTAEVWKRHGPGTGLARPEYDAYFVGARVAVAISLVEVTQLRRHVPLAELRERWTGFRPPQSFRYIDALLAGAVL
jgi:predicted transcriptional regulator